MSEWLRGLQARADRAPAMPRIPWHAGAGDSAIGTIEPALAQRLVADGLGVLNDGASWRVAGAGAPLDAAFARVAEWLRAQGLASAWRNELLRVDDAAGMTIGLIERAAVRPLGITTRAVHLVGWAEQGGMWVQQRAFDKPTDPGQWDTLMGGLVSADESLATTLVRETWEEAGLHVDALRDVAACGRLGVRRPVSTGYMVEHIHVHEAVIPAQLVPQNQDGEVAAFERLGVDALRERLHVGAFTLEASLILADSLRRRGYAC